MKTIKDLEEIAHLIGVIFYYGDFKAETYNERRLEELLIKSGYRYMAECALLKGAEKYDK
jgi:hypothetical protein